MTTLGRHFGTHGLVTMFHRESLDSRKLACIDRVQNGEQVSRFCLDHSRARNERVIQKKICNLAEETIATRTQLLIIIIIHVTGSLNFILNFDT